MSRSLKNFFRYAAVVLGIVLLALAVVVSIPLAPTVPALEARPGTQYWTMDAGYRLAYTHVPATAPRDGPPVIFLHGGLGGFVSTSAIEDLGRLAEHGYVLTSPGEIEPPRFDDDGNWINEELYPVPDSLEFLDPPDVSDEMKVRSWPPRFIATVALATALNVKWMSDEEADAALNTVATTISPGMVCDPSSVPGFEAGLGMGAYSHGFSNWFGDVDDWRAELREADVPLLVLQGQCDVFPYATVYEHAALAPRGRYRFIEGAGHRIRWDRPEKYLEEILRFLDDGAR